MTGRLAVAVGASLLALGGCGSAATPVAHVTPTPVAPTTPPPVPAWLVESWGSMTPAAQEHACDMLHAGDSDAFADLVNAGRARDELTYREAEDWLTFNCSAWDDGTTGNPKPHDHNDGTHSH